MEKYSTIINLLKLKVEPRQFETVADLEDYIFEFAAEYELQKKTPNVDAFLKLSYCLNNLKPIQVLYHLKHSDINTRLQRISEVVAGELRKLYEVFDFAIDKFEEQLGYLFFGKAIPADIFMSLTEVPWFKTYSSKVLWKYGSKLSDEEIENDPDSIMKDDGEVFKINIDNLLEGSNLQKITLPKDVLVAILPYYEGHWREFILDNRMHYSEVARIDDGNHIYLEYADGSTAEIYMEEKNYLNEEEEARWNTRFHEDEIIQLHYIVNNPFELVLFIETTTDPRIIELAYPTYNVLLMRSIASNRHTPEWILKEIIEDYLLKDSFNDNWVVCTGVAKNTLIPEKFPEIFEQLVYYPHIKVKEAAAENINIKSRDHFIYLLEYTRNLETKNIASPVTNAAIKNVKFGEFIDSSYDLHSLLLQLDHSGFQFLINNSSLDRKMLFLLLSICEFILKDEAKIGLINSVIAKRAASPPIELSQYFFSLHKSMSSSRSITQDNVKAFLEDAKKNSSLTISESDVLSSTNLNSYELFILIKEVLELKSVDIVKYQFLLSILTRNLSLNQYVVRTLHEQLVIYFPLENTDSLAKCEENIYLYNHRSQIIDCKLYEWIQLFGNSRFLRDSEASSIIGLLDNSLDFQAGYSPYTAVCRSLSKHPNLSPETKDNAYQLYRKLLGMIPIKESWRTEP